MRTPSRQEFERLASTLAELERRVTENCKDLDMQFQRIADLQAVIDRMQIAATKARTKDNSL